MILSARCISKAWVCDGDSDCEDNSDEDNCEALVCKLSHHMCATNDSICLPAEKLCDGTDDCPDGSDEKLCGKKHNTTMFSVPDGFVIHLSYWYSKQCCSPVSANPIISISSLQTCVHWIMVVVVTTAASFLGRASCVLVPLAWSWEQTTRPARSRASAPNISSVARSASRKNPVSSVPATKVGSWRLTWRAAKVLVRKKESLLQTEECIFGFKLRVKYLGQKKLYNSHSI